jgi:ABC-type transporter Mla subunit MlaD
MRAHFSKAAGLLSALLLLSVIAPPGSRAQQHRRDPLNQLEVDQLRETAVEPEKRLKLYLRFARERLAGVEQARSDLKANDRAQQIRDRLQDFLDVYDELNENIDNFADRKDDIRKPLNAIIEADTEFQAKIRALRSASGAEAKGAETYQVLLENALDALDIGAKDHRQLLTEQQQTAAKKKK